MSSKEIFGNVRGADLYLFGEIPTKSSSFGPSFDGEICVVPFKLYEFATRDIYDDSWVGRKAALDEWVKKGGVENIDRFLAGRDLTSALKKGDVIELFVDFPPITSWREGGSNYVPAENIKKLVLSHVR